MASSRLPRAFHKLRANFSGYFWLPCPLCGEMFGGHEYSKLYIHPTPKIGQGKCVCNDCGVQAIS